MNRSFSLDLLPFLKGTALKRGAIFGSILIVALAAFEIFNYSTTLYALTDVLGDLSFAGMRWAAILAVAFCAIDFAGLARLFTPEQGRSEPAEVWYLFAAWVLAAGFNAVLTWWGVSVAILGNTPSGGTLVGQAALTRTVPLFVAGMVWLIRVLIIGTFSIAGERLFTLADSTDAVRYQHRPASSSPRPATNPSAGHIRPAPRPNYAITQAAPQSEPSYHPVGLSARADEREHSLRN